MNKAEAKPYVEDNVLMTFLIISSSPSYMPEREREGERERERERERPPQKNKNKNNPQQQKTTTTTKSKKIGINLPKERQTKKLPKKNAPTTSSAQRKA